MSDIIIPMNKNEINVIKADGTEEEWDSSKLRESLERSGADEKIILEIIDHIEDELVEGMTTEDIYKHSYAMLKERTDYATTFRYSLRRAIAELGPSGFPFERFVGEIYKLRGYKVSVGIKLQGKYINHEVDVIAENDEEIMTAELKFHNKLKIKTDVKVLMYVKSRFDDIENAGYYGDKKKSPYVITNTKFSDNAIKFGNGYGMGMIGWNYPRNGGNLHDLVVTTGLHPLTCLSTLSDKQKNYFLEKGYILCRELTEDNYKILEENSFIPKDKIAEIKKEIEDVCECVDGTCLKDERQKSVDEHREFHK